MEHEIMLSNYHIPSKVTEKNGSARTLCTGLNLASVLDRLRTFNDFPDPSLNTTNLADAGFYYVHKDNVIKCVFCDISIFDFEINNLQNHKCCKNSSCESDYILGNLVDDENENIENEITDASEEDVNSITQLEQSAREAWLDNIGICTNVIPKFEHFLSNENRLKSFDNYPNRKLKFDKLSEAGFFYLGSEDRTVCFHCGGGLKEWREKDDPWVEHAYWFPRCRYLLMTKGKEFVRKAWGRQYEIASPEEIRNTADALKEFISMLTSKKNNSTQTALQKDNKIDISDIYWSSEEEPSSSCNKMIVKNVNEPRPMCKVCYIEERNTMFSPCCHIVACEHCAVNIKKCVVCREEIKHTVRVFLA